MAQTLLRWGLEHGTSVIPKSSTPNHIQASVIATLDSVGNSIQIQVSVAWSGFVMESSQTGSRAVVVAETSAAVAAVCLAKNVALQCCARSVSSS